MRDVQGVIKSWIIQVKLFKLTSAAFMDVYCIYLAHNSSPFVVQTQLYPVWLHLNQQGM